MSWRHAAMAVSLAGITVSMATPALAQTWSNEQLEVWDVIQAQWQASMEEDATWPERFLHESFLGWANENPAPRDEASTDKWNRYGMENSTTLMQELYPVGIIVQGNTAVAHYFSQQQPRIEKGSVRRRMVGIRMCSCATGALGVSLLGTVVTIPKTTTEQP